MQLKISFKGKPGMFCIDKNSGKKCRITDETKNSIEVEIPPNSSKGILSRNYFTIENFNKRFDRV